MGLLSSPSVRDDIYSGKIDTSTQKYVGNNKYDEVKPLKYDTASTQAAVTAVDSPSYWDSRRSRYDVSAGDQYLNSDGNVMSKNLVKADSRVGSGNGLANSSSNAFGTLTDSNGNVMYLDQASSNAIQESGGLFGNKDGLTFKATNPADASGGFSMDGLKAGTGAALDIVNAGLALKGYSDKKKLMNKQMEAMDLNIQNAKTEAAATKNYRKAYGA